MPKRLMSLALIAVYCCGFCICGTAAAGARLADSPGPSPSLRSGVRGREVVFEPPTLQPPLTKVVPADAPLSVFTTADELLAALEEADKGLKTLTADLIYDRTFATAGDQQSRKGKLYFVVSGSGDNGGPRGSDAASSASRKFAIHFDTIIIGGRTDTDPRQYIFDGQWLLEKYPKDKRATKRQVVPPGEKFDPLRIGEGPMPIPIGQKRADILGRYAATLLAASDGLDANEEKDLIEFVAGSYQLKLVPRPERASEEKFTEIRLWYRADADGRILPRMAKTINALAGEPGDTGDESLVRLLGVVQNGAIPAGAIDTQIPEGWDSQTIPFREAATRSGRGANTSGNSGAGTDKSGEPATTTQSPGHSPGQGPVATPEEVPDDAAEDDAGRTREPK